MVESLYPIPGRVGTGRGADRQASSQQVAGDSRDGGGGRGALTPPKGRAQEREAYDFITKPTPMTSPGGQGARPSKLFMETAGGQAYIQILSCFRCGWIELPAGPVGPQSPAGRQAEEEGGRLEESSRWGQGSLELMGAPAEMSRVPGSSLLESAHLYPCSSRTSLWCSLKVRLAELRKD